MAPRCMPLLLLCALAGCLPRSSYQLLQSVPVLPARTRAPASLTFEGTTCAGDDARFRTVHACAPGARTPARRTDKHADVNQETHNNACLPTSCPFNKQPHIYNEVDNENHDEHDKYNEVNHLPLGRCACHNSTITSAS
jgi:hypothetical protein